MNVSQRGTVRTMRKYIVFDTDELDAEELSDKLPVFATVTGYHPSLGMAGIEIPADGDPWQYMEIGEAVANLPDGRFPTFSVMGTEE